MVNYELGVRNNGYSITFDLSKLIPDKKDKCIFDIDKLTSEFASEEKLKMFLVNNGLMPKDLLNDKLNIVYKNNKTLPVVLQEQRVYIDRLFKLSGGFKRYISLDDPNFRSIVGYFPALTKMLRNTEFLEELIQEYQFVPVQKQNILELKAYLSQSKIDSNDIIANIALFELLKRVLLKKETNKYNQDVNYVINYRGLRDLAFIIYRYNEKNRLRKLKRQLEMDKAEDAALIEEEQCDFIFHEEPDFPYNSEEAKDYQKYLENLPSEEHPHYRR